MSRGFFAVGIYRTKTEPNIGTLWRSANLYGAAFVFTVGRRYNSQASDTMATPKHTPLFHFDSIADLREHLPWSCPLVGVELDARSQPLSSYEHPERAAYLLGAEDEGLPPRVLSVCHNVVQIEAEQPWSLNVAVAGSLVVYDRHIKMARRLTVA